MSALLTQTKGVVFALYRFGVGFALGCEVWACRLRGVESLCDRTPEDQKIGRSAFDMVPVKHAVLKVSRNYGSSAQSVGGRGGGFVLRRRVMQLANIWSSKS